MERAVLFKFKSPSSISIVGPSGCGKTCLPESLLVHDLSDLFVQPPTAIVYCYGAWQDKFDHMKHTGIKFHEGVPDVSHPFEKRNEEVMVKEAKEEEET